MLGLEPPLLWPEGGLYMGAPRDFRDTLRVS